jgi:hypothetical protein
MDTPEAREELERLFSGLANASPKYEIRSERTDSYNCIAYAVGVETICWEPFNEPDTFWPKVAPKDFRITSLIDAYRSIGFEVDANGEWKSDREKIALYARPSGEYGHAAVLRKPGCWASKIGELEDIEHGTLEAVNCEAYGAFHCFMSRPLVASENDPRKHP